MLPYRRLFKYQMGRYRGSYEISSKYRLIIRNSIYRSIAIPSSIDIERSQISRYFDISSIEPALIVCSLNMCNQIIFALCTVIFLCYSSNMFNLL